MNRELSLGYSPCPNDTFIFYGLTHGRIPVSGLTFRERLEDVETLNTLALGGALDLTKISYHALGHLRHQYVLLRSGGALGRGCGPLVVARQGASMASLQGKRIAVPGRLTTANLLLQLFGEGFADLLILPFHDVLRAVASGEAEAGVIIHESRFTFQRFGLFKVLDLGEWWEQETGLPIPLGGILARRAMGEATIRKVEAALRQSVEYARRYPAEPRAYIRAHAQEIEEDVIDRHIALYVNDFSLDVGEEGEQAVRYLLTRAEERGIIPPCELPLFI